MIHTHATAARPGHMLAAILGRIPMLSLGADARAALDVHGGLATVLRAHGCSLGCAAQLHYADGALVVLMCGDAVGEA